MPVPRPKTDREQMREAVKDLVSRRAQTKRRRYVRVPEARRQQANARAVMRRG